jgi:hypothetical protein
MTVIQDGTLIADVVDELNLQPGAASIMQQLGDKVNLVYSINRKFTSVLRNSANSATGSSLIYTTPPDKDFYLVAVVMGITKNVTSDGTGAIITVVTEGSIKNMLRIPLETLTAVSQTISLVLPFPLKLDRNSAISHSHTFAAGAETIATSIMGFIL